MSVNHEALVAKYIANRDEISRINDEAKAKVAGLKAEMDNIDKYMLMQLDSSGATSSKCPSGTVSIVTKTFAGFEDRQKTVEWVRETGILDILTLSVNKKGVETYIETNGDLPPGVKITTERAISVRRG